MDARFRGDAGTSLVEVLMAIMILGITAAALLGGLTTIVIGSDMHRKQSDAGVILTTAAELLKSADHVPCAPATEQSYIDAVRSAPLPSNWDTADITIESVRYWNGAIFQSGDANCFDDDTDGMLDLQEVTVQVASPDGRAKETVVVVKGDGE